MHEDRPAAWRIASAIQGAAPKWPEAKKLLNYAREVAAKEDSALESEEENNNHSNNFITSGFGALVNGNYTYGGEAFYKSSSLKSKRDSEDGADFSSSDDEELPDPYPEPSTQIRKARRFSKIQQMGPRRTRLDSDDDQEVQNPYRESSDSYTQNRRDSNKTPSETSSHTPTRLPSGKLTIKVTVPPKDNDKGKAPVKDMYGPPPSEDEDMEGLELY